MKKVALVVAVGLGLLVAFGLIAMFNRRATLRREFTAYLQAARPDLTLTETPDDALLLRDSSGQEVGTLFFDRIYREAPADPMGRQLLYSMMVATIAEGQAAAELGPEDVDRVMPRIVNERFRARMRSEYPVAIPVIPLGVGDLSVAFVLDSTSSVAYLGSDQLQELSLDTTSALQRAKQNLARRFHPEDVRRALLQPEGVVVQSRDTYDAARLLLVPDHLAPGEALAAMIPDRDTLVLQGVPSDGNWTRCRELATNASGEPLFAEPLLVTAAGLQSAPPPP